eukprot:18393_1
MAEGDVFIHVIAIIFLTSISIASLLVLYQLFSGFYCPKGISNTTKTPEQSISSEPNIESSSSVSSDEKYQPVLKFFKRNTIAACVIFSIICVVCVIDHISLLWDQDRETDHFLLLLLPLYFIGRILLSLIFIARLHYTFKGSAFGYSKCTVNSLIGAWCVMVFCSLLSVMLSTPSALRAELPGLALGVVFILIDVALLFILLYGYGKKLEVLLMSGDASFLSLITRYSWLYTVCFMTTFAVILSFVAQLVSMAALGENVFPGEAIAVFVSIDSLVNSLCLWLNLRTADRWYKILCRWGDNQCRKCCRSCTGNTDAVKNTNMVNDVVISGSDATTSDCDNKPVQKETIVIVESSGTGNQAIIL